MDAILFVLRTGCQWNALNATGICSSSSAHRRFQEWTEAGVFEAFWREGLLAYDELVGIDWTWLSLDGAMGKAPLGGEKNRPQPDRPRQGGVKRSVLTNGRGVPIGIVIAGANVNDHLLMAETLDTLAVPRPRSTQRAPQHLCLDKGYDYAVVRTLAKEHGFRLHLRRRGEEAQAKRHRGAKARRWVVERAHAWLSRFRAILIRWPKKPQNYRAFIHFACGIITAQQTLPG